ncbi:MAG: rhodanese-like domain-containing protein [Lysobacter sp.]|nr:rhodanese-like domain-containing protein [Lysobacter sp.]
MKAQRTTLLATFLLSAGLVLPAFALAQKAPPAPNYPPVVGKLVADTKKQIKTIKMDEFRAALDKKELGKLIDVRQEDEYADGFVPGAVNIPRGLIEFRIWKALGFPNAVDMNQRLTLYCATGGRCALATKSLQDLGFTNVVSADMKFEDWEKAGHPVEKPKK